MDFKAYLQECQQRIQHYLETVLPAVSTQPSELHEAMRYSVLNGGKRLRAMLVYATADALLANAELDAKAYQSSSDACAAAVELVHAYSLIHDDLPAMDDDDLRRGKPTCHKAFSEATAILAGDALQSHAFSLLASANLKLPAEIQVTMLRTLANAINSHGMAGGQALDMSAENQLIDLHQLENIHRMKTGALIIASVQLGALAAQCGNKHRLDLLSEYAASIGLAFQIRDDIIDIESSSEILGKTQGADITSDKATYPKLLGLDGAKQKAQRLYEHALSCLDKTGVDFTRLRELAEFVIARVN